MLQARRPVGPGTLTGDRVGLEPIFPKHPLEVDEADVRQPHRRNPHPVESRYHRRPLVISPYQNQTANANPNTTPSANAPGTCPVIQLTMASTLL